MKLEETENLKLHSVDQIKTNTTHIKNIQESDTDLIETITEILNIYERNPNFKGKPSFKKWCNYCQRFGHSKAECRQKQKDNQNKPQKQKEPNKSFNQYMKKDQNLPNKNIYNNNSSGKPIPSNSNSKNGVIIADDTDTVLSNVDKNNKIIRINLESTEYPINHSTIHEK